MKEDFSNSHSDRAKRESFFDVCEYLAGTKKEEREQLMIKDVYMSLYPQTCNE